jgi:hypothetical protein
LPESLVRDIEAARRLEALQSAIDFAGLAGMLRKGKKPTQARLVEFMAYKPKATVQDVAEHVHGDSAAGDRTVSANARRVSDWLAEQGVPLSFRVASGYVFREIAPK